jgi:hypothetical protein
VPLPEPLGPSMVMTGVKGIGDGGWGIVGDSVNALA